MLTRTALALAVALPFVLLGAASPPAGAVPVSGVSGRVAAPDGLNLRTGPGASYDALHTLPDGTALALETASGDWFKVRALGSTG